MIQSDKYLTIGVQSDIDIKLQIIMWLLLAELKAHDDIEEDYLQVFDLKPIEKDNTHYQQVIHHQEVPSYEFSFAYEEKNPITEKVFIIRSSHEDGTPYYTMLLSSEY